MHISWLFLSMSTIVTFVVLLLLVRWIGSTQLTQLTFFNWVAGASMGNIAANMIAATNVRDWLASCYALALFTAVAIVAAVLSLKFRHFRRVANGEPVVLIHEGEVVRDNLRKTKVNMDMLLMMLREKGYFEYNEIQFGILEPTGDLSILPRKGAQSASKADLANGPDLSEAGDGPYIELIVDGEIDYAKLTEMKYDEAWLAARLRALGVKQVARVMYLAVNHQGHLIADIHRHTNDTPEQPLM